jgi:hypothetical protein
MAYATQASVEQALGRSLTTSEAAGLTSLLAAVDSYINKTIGRSFGAGVESTRYYDVERSRMVDVDPFVTSEVDGESIVQRAFEVFYVDADENKVQDVDASEYEARPRNENVKTWLQRRNGYWGSGCPSNVTNLAVKAYFGGGAVPADISYAASWLAAQAISAQLGMSLSVKSESIEGYSRTFADMTKDNVQITSIFENYHEVLI